MDLNRNLIPPSVDRLIALASAADGARDWDLSVKLWGECLFRFPEDHRFAHWLEMKAKALTELGKFAEAVDCYSDLVEKVPDYPCGHEGLARVGGLQRDHLLIAENLKQCLLKFPDHERRHGWLLERGYALLETGLYHEAAASFESAVADFPTERYAYSGLAATAEQQWKFRRAIDLWDRCIEIGTGEDREEALHRRAWCLVEIGEISQARSAFEAIAYKVEGLEGLARIASGQDTPRAAGQCWDRCIATFPDKINGYLGKAFLLFEREAFREADALLSHIISTFPDSITAHVLYARSATSAKDWKEAERRWSALLVAHAKHPEVCGEYSRYLAAVGAPDRASEYFERFNDQPATKAHCQLDYHLASDNFGVAVNFGRMLVELESQKPLSKYRLTYALMREGSDAALYAAFSILRELNQTAPDAILARMQFVEACIRSGKDDLACGLIEAFPADDRRPEIDKFRAWLAHRQSDENAAKQYWRSILEREFSPATHAPIETFRRIDRGDVKAAPGELLLLSVMRNEMPRLPWFLDYYRKLGVEKFVIVDNMSTDGSVEFLLGNEDVILYQTSDRYSAAGAGMRWVNELVDRHGRHGWCLHVDADEAFIFPGGERSDLKQFTEYLDSSGYEAVLAPLLDMFPSVVSTEGSSDFQALQAPYVFLDNSLRSYPSAICPYQEIFGGVRRRLFGGFQLLNKVPLINGAAGIRFLMSSHRVTSARMADVTGALLHYHLVYILRSEYRALLAEAIERREFPSNSLERLRSQILAEKLLSSASLLGESSIRFESTDQLVELGLMQTSPKFKSAQKRSD